MAELLPVGTSSASSADFTIAAGGSAIVALKNATGSSIALGASVDIELKIGSLYFFVYTMTRSSPARIIQGDALAATTWRVTRAATGVPSGVQQL